MRSVCSHNCGAVHVWTLWCLAPPFNIYSQVLVVLVAGELTQDRLAVLIRLANLPDLWVGILELSSKLNKATRELWCLSKGMVAKVIVSGQKISMQTGGIFNLILINSITGTSPFNKNKSDISYLKTCRTFEHSNPLKSAPGSHSQSVSSSVSITSICLLLAFLLSVSLAWLCLHCLCFLVSISNL